MKFLYSLGVKRFSWYGLFIRSLLASARHCCPLSLFSYCGWICGFQSGFLLAEVTCCSFAVGFWLGGHLYYGLTRVLVFWSRCSNIFLIVCQFDDCRACPCLSIHVVLVTLSLYRFFWCFCVQTLPFILLSYSSQYFCYASLLHDYVMPWLC